MCHLGFANDMKVPNKSVAGKAGITARLAIGHHCPSLPELERSPTLRAKRARLEGLKGRRYDSPGQSESASVALGHGPKNRIPPFFRFDFAGRMARKIKSEKWVGIWGRFTRDVVPG